MVLLCRTGIFSDLGRSLDLSLVPQGRIAYCWCQENPQLHATHQSCVDVLLYAAAKSSLTISFAVTNVTKLAQARSKFPTDNDSVHAHHALLLEETLTMS